MAVATAEIILQDQDGRPKPVSKAALVSLFRTLNDNVRVVLLNACSTQPQAEALGEIIDCVVGMNKPIQDGAAILFAASFYRAIGFGRSVREAFDLGKVALLLEGIPEDQTPEMFVRKGVDATTLNFREARQGERKAEPRRAPYLLSSCRFPETSDFVGRSDDLERLHAVLQCETARRHRPAGLTGMGGIGKTQLAVEYVYRSERDTTTPAAFSGSTPPNRSLTTPRVRPKLRPETLDQSPNHQLRAAFDRARWSSRRLDCLR